MLQQTCATTATSIPIVAASALPGDQTLRRLRPSPARRCSSRCWKCRRGARPAERGLHRRPPALRCPGYELWLQLASTPAVKNWLIRLARIELHFTPNIQFLAQPRPRWFAELTNPRLRRSAHASIREFQADINAWTDAWNDGPKPFAWTKIGDEILEAITRSLQVINDSGHSFR